MTRRNVYTSRKQAKGWHVLLAWIIFIVVCWFSFTHLSVYVGAPVIVLSFVLTWALTEAYANGL